MDEARSVQERRSGDEGHPRPGAYARRVTQLPQTQVLPAPSSVTQRETEYRLDEGDHERLSHYVDKNKLTEAMVMGTPVVALCGKVWVPSRNPDKFPVCPECKEIWESIPDKGDKG